MAKKLGGMTIDDLQKEIEVMVSSKKALEQDLARLNKERNDLQQAVNTSYEEKVAAEKEARELKAKAESYAQKVRGEAEALKASAAANEASAKDLKYSWEQARKEQSDKDRDLDARANTLREAQKELAKKEANVKTVITELVRAMA